MDEEHRSYTTLHPAQAPVGVSTLDFAHSLAYRLIAGPRNAIIMITMIDSVYGNSRRCAAVMATAVSASSVLERRRHAYNFGVLEVSNPAEIIWL